VDGARKRDVRRTVVWNAPRAGAGESAFTSAEVRQLLLRRSYASSGLGDRGLPSTATSSIFRGLWRELLSLDLCADTLSGEFASSGGGLPLEGLRENTPRPPADLASSIDEAEFLEERGENTPRVLIRVENTPRVFV